MDNSTELPALSHDKRCPMSGMQCRFIDAHPYACNADRHVCRMAADALNRGEARFNRFLMATRMHREGCALAPMHAITKKAAVKDWLKTPTSMEELHQWIFHRGSNYGVVCGERSNMLLVADFDDLQSFTRWRARVEPKTLTVASSRGVHVYARVTEASQLPRNKTRLVMDERHIGEILTTGSGVVGAGSINPAGALYRIIEDHPIRTIADLGELKLPLENPIAQAVPFNRVVSVAQPATLTDAYLRAAVEGVLRDYAPTRPGERNVRLFKSACRLFNLGLQYGDVVQMLAPIAEQQGLHMPEIHHAISSAFRAERRPVNPRAMNLQTGARRSMSPVEKRDAMKRARGGRR